MEDEHFLIVEITIFIFTFLIHVFGIYVLIKRPKLVSKNQRLYLLSLSSTEAILSLDHIILNTAHLLSSSHLPKTIWVAVIEIVHYDGVWIVNLTTMIMLTLDRYAEVLLNIKYGLYITRKRTQLLVISLWLFGILITVIFTMLYFIYSIDYYDISYRYIYPVLDTAVVLNAIIVYLYIFIKRVRSNKDLPHFRSSEQNKKITSKPKFFIPFLILFTYLIFLYIPDVIHFTNINSLNKKEWFTRLSTILYSLNMISDASIYIFLQRGVWRLYLRELHLFYVVDTLLPSIFPFLYYHNQTEIHRKISTIREMRAASKTEET